MLPSIDARCREDGGLSMHCDCCCDVVASRFFTPPSLDACRKGGLLQERQVSCQSIRWAGGAVGVCRTLIELL